MTLSSLVIPHLAVQIVFVKRAIMVLHHANVLRDILGIHIWVVDQNVHQIMTVRQIRHAIVKISVAILAPASAELTPNVTFQIISLIVYALKDIQAMLEQIAMKYKKTLTVRNENTFVKN
jgi:hypothetical protein